jgi:type I restriction enzyme M protein
MKTRGSDRLGRYYTKNDIGALLIDQMDGLSPSRILDLGAGAGSLSKAALERWSDVELLTVDVDAAAQIHLINLFSGTGCSKHNHIRADALSSRLPVLISAKAEFIDAAVCNPPFIVPKWRKGFAQIIEEAGFSGCLSVLADVDAALLFLAQNMRLLSANATLGIILPDSLVSAFKYRLFRKELLARYMVRKVIRLPRSSFVNTDAQAYIVVISKGSATTQKIPLIKFSSTCETGSEVWVNVDDAIERLDYGYHAQRLDQHRQQHNCVPLGTFVEELKRGSLSSAEARLARFPVLHTTNITAQLAGSWCDLTEFGQVPNKLVVNKQVVCAEPGDILVARVGRNLEQKVLGVSSGYPALTDCVYKLRVQKQSQDKVLLQLSSPQGQAWLASRAYGVSARHLTKTDLLAFPIA